MLNGIAYMMGKRARFDSPKGLGWTRGRPVGRAGTYSDSMVEIS